MAELGASPSGRTLSGAEWLEAHHRAKLPERQAFCRRLADLEPSSVLDVGCASGLWLDELDALLPTSVPFVGVDSDPFALELARERAEAWERVSKFELRDADAAIGLCEPADLTLLFNVSGYLSNLDDCLRVLAARRGTVALRQYDGAALRFGPMDPDDRAAIDDALRASLSTSESFRHYDMDRLIKAASAAGFRDATFEFELCQRTAPFPPEFQDYFQGTLDWTAEHLSDATGALLDAWRRELTAAAYFTEVDLVALLS